MVKGLYSYLQSAWQNREKEAEKTRLVEWRASESIVRVDKPLRLDRARSLGYKAKKGIVVVRIRILRGGRKRSKHTHGRKSRKQHTRKILKMSYQWVAENRVASKFPNLEVLNSYYIGKDGKNYFFEVILVDPERPEIMSDKNYSWLSLGSHKGRSERGLTSAAKKSRGLSTKSRDLKVRPSLRSWNRKGK